MAQNALVVAVAKQFGAKLLPDSDRYKHRMEIRSQSSTRLYVVSWDTATRAWACKCPGWIRHRHCKHLDEMRPQLERATNLKQIGGR